MKVQLREREGKVTKVRIFIGDKRFDITESLFGDLSVLTNGTLCIKPGSSNVVDMDVEDPSY